MKPKEGTILTVAKGMADKAAELAPQTEDVLEFSEKVLEYGEYVLSQTPEMLPVLKEAGVVDSGGQGLLEVFRGAFDGYLGKEIDYTAFEKAAPASSVTKISPQAEADIKFGYRRGSYSVCIGKWSGKNSNRRRKHAGSGYPFWLLYGIYYQCRKTGG